uniref:Uncharacterized protein n=1 Tax=Lygus hesperus TaxID=30085 RepID=A0A146KZC7_LYGHE
MLSEYRIEKPTQKEAKNGFIENLKRSRTHSYRENSSNIQNNRWFLPRKMTCRQCKTTNLFKLAPLSLFLSAVAMYPACEKRRSNRTDVVTWDNSGEVPN